MPSTISQYSFFLPKFWPIWLALYLLRAVVLLPHRWRMQLAKTLGNILYRFSKRRRRIAEINIALCFPQKTPAEQQQLIQKNFESTGKAPIEIGMGWWDHANTIRNISQIHGIEHLHQALSYNKGIILLSAHFTMLELGIRILQLNINHPLYGVYQKHKNPLLEKIIYTRRTAKVPAIAQDNIRQVIKVLRKNAIVWYAPDQGYNDKHSALVPFFDIPAQSNTATSRLAKLSGAKVLPFIIRRIDNRNHYEVIIEPPIINFPSNDEVADTHKYHQHMETAIKKSPSQYLWVHRRFKNRPAEFPNVYK